MLSHLVGCGSAQAIDIASQRRQKLISLFLVVAPLYLLPRVQVGVLVSRSVVEPFHLCSNSQIVVTMTMTTEAQAAKATREKQHLYRT